MSIPRFVYVAGGAAAMRAIHGIGKLGKGRGMGRGVGGSDTVHSAAVTLVAAGMRAADVISAATQTIADEAADINVEARRQARIDAAVKERLDALEGDIRAEVIAEIDGEAEEV